MALSHRVGWHADDDCERKASVRLRMLEPMAILRQRGIDAGIYRRDVGPGGYQAIVFSKCYTREAIEIAREARSRGAGVVFDLCDNLFESKKTRSGRGAPQRLREMLMLATHLSFSTATLARQVTELYPEVADKVRVVPDLLDYSGNASPPDKLMALPGLKPLSRFLGRHSGALHCVWFGNSMGRLSGFAHLQPGIRQLEAFARDHPVTLTIISNDRWRYWLAAPRWKIPSHYMSWSLASFRPALEMHRAAIIPVEKNSYTIGKTINRPATALMAGLGVVADAIDSYEELRSFIALDDWQGGLRYYHATPPHADGRVEAAQAHLMARYGRDAIGGHWESLIAEAVAKGGA